MQYNGMSVVPGGGQGTGVQISEFAVSQSCIAGHFLGNFEI
jgi:hypothetical protein